MSASAADSEVSNLKPKEEVGAEENEYDVEEGRG
jgi:hypothetical protein